VFLSVKVRAMATKRQGIFQGASRTSRKQARVASALPGTTYAWDIASDALNWAPNAAEILGLTKRDLPRTGRAFAQLIEPGSGRARYDIIADQASSSGSYETRHALRLDPDQVLMVEDCGRWQPDIHGRPAFVRGLLRADPALATQNCLPTRIAARSELLRQIQNGVNEALRVSQTCTLIVGALDEADRMDEVARKLRPMMRRHDVFGIVSPTSFALALVGCPASDAVSAMNRMAGFLKGCDEALILGAACAPDHTFKATKLLRFAEEAVASSRARGSDKGFYDPRPAPRSRAVEQAPFDIVAALNDRSLVLASRPVMDAQTRHRALSQAIAALSTSDAGAIPLGPIPGLDNANLALLVDGRMLELAADYLARTPQARLSLPVAPATLKDAEWLPMLAAHLGARPGIESRLVIEVPEIALAGDGALQGRLHAMKAIGVGLSLSGYGTGHVSAAQLRHMPFDLLKIDGIFIQPLKRSTQDRLYIRALIDRAQNCGIAVAAEWVDDEMTARLLTSWGVDYLEGSLFGELAALVQPSPLRDMLERAWG
jgi:EAL domain-containing protein (putative c-di-GMP-specific phosphodiesterase class I)